MPRGESALFPDPTPESLTFPESRTPRTLHAEGAESIHTRSSRRPRSLFSRRERGERRERRHLLRRGGVRPPPRAGAAAIDARRCAAQSAKMPPRDFVASGIRRLTGLRFFGRRRYRAAFFGFSPRDFVRRPSPPQARFSRNPGPSAATPRADKPERNPENLTSREPEPEKHPRHPGRATRRSMGFQPTVKRFRRLRLDADRFLFCVINGNLAAQRHRV